MAKVAIFGAVLLVIIAAIAVGTLVIGGSAKLTSLFWRGRKNKEERDEEKPQGPHGPVGGGPGSGWV